MQNQKKSIGLCKKCMKSRYHVRGIVLDHSRRQNNSFYISPLIYNSDVTWPTWPHVTLKNSQIYKLWDLWRTPCMRPVTFISDSYGHWRPKQCQNQTAFFALALIGKRAGWTLFSFFFQMTKTSIEISVTRDVTRQLYHAICKLPSRNHYSKPLSWRKINTFIERTPS